MNFVCTYGKHSKIPFYIAKQQINNPVKCNSLVIWAIIISYSGKVMFKIYNPDFNNIWMHIQVYKLDSTSPVLSQLSWNRLKTIYFAQHSMIYLFKKKKFWSFFLPLLRHYYVILFCWSDRVNILHRFALTFQVSNSPHISLAPVICHYCTLGLFKCWQWEHACFKPAAVVQ